MSYRQLSDHYRRIAHLGHVGAIIGWDEAVMMSARGGESRAEAQATLDVLVHGLRSDPRVAGWLDTAENEVLSGLEHANVREMRREYVRATALDADLVEARKRASVRCEQAWRSQRGKSDWAGHLPLLEQVVSLEREAAQALADALGLDPYDALLDGFDPGMRTSMIDPVFDEIATWLPGMLARVVDAQSDQNVVEPSGPFPVETQRELATGLMRAVGFDFDRGRVDVSHHPFCGGVPDDVRITTRYDEADFTRALMGVLHETGHAKYDQGLPVALLDQPVGQPRGMAVHESQSLLMEMQICRSPAFVRFLAPRLHTAFPEQAAAQPRAFDDANLVRLYSRVKPGFIRVDADEVTYPLHILLRYRMERDLIAGTLAAANLPQVWDEAMNELLGLSTGENHCDGCMQDVHWAAGALGYFPTYTLGALLAAQLFETARADLGDLDASIEAGDLTALDAWLAAKIWIPASTLETPDLIEHATGEPLSSRAFRAHLERRYLPA